MTSSKAAGYTTKRTSLPAAASTITPWALASFTASCRNHQPKGPPRLIEITWQPLFAACRMALVRLSADSCTTERATRNGRMRACGAIPVTKVAAALCEPSSLAITLAVEVPCEGCCNGPPSSRSTGRWPSM